MKISKEHYDHMMEAIRPLMPKLEQHFAYIKGKSKDPAMRLRWDAAHAAKLTSFFCDSVYPYANDEHIDTALRSIMREIFPSAS